MSNNILAVFDDFIGIPISWSILASFNIMRINATFWPSFSLRLHAVKTRAAEINLLFVDFESTPGVNPWVKPRHQLLGHPRRRPPGNPREVTPGENTKWYPWGAGIFKSDTPGVPRRGGGLPLIWITHYLMQERIQKRISHSRPMTSFFLWNTPKLK